MIFSDLTSPDLTPLQKLKKETNVFWRSDGSFAPALVTELSRTGAFIKTSKPAPVGTALQILLDAPRREICAQALVKRVVPGQGMAVEFDSIAEQERVRLDAWLAWLGQLEKEQAVQANAAPSDPQKRPATPSPVQAVAPEPAPRNRRVDNRAVFRYQSGAEVQLTEAGSNQTLQTQLADLGRCGCYVKLEKPFPVGTSLELSITENGQSFGARAEVVSAQPGNGMGLKFTAVDPKQLLVLDGWLAASMEARWLTSNRRRSHRVMVSIPVHVTAKNSAGIEILEETKTISINAHGALLGLQMEVTKGQTIVLHDPSTQKALECAVLYLGSTQDGLREVGVSFIRPNQTLWKVSFPPEGWSPQHPDARRATEAEEPEVVHEDIEDYLSPDIGGSE
jgi:PilZ domain